MDGGDQYAEQSAHHARCASQSGRTICKIPKGETVKVLKKGDWAKVEYDGEQGYVNGKYLKYEE